MFEDDDDESGFWSNVPTSRFDRLNAKRQQAKVARAHRSSRPVGSRAHDDTQSIQVVAAPTVARVKDAAGHVDPLLRRTGTLAVVIALLVPVALALRSGDETSRDTALQPQSSLAAEPTASVVDPAIAPAAEATPATLATIDIDALPEAIPVNTEAPAREAAPAATTAAAVAPAAPRTAAPQPKIESAPANGGCAKKYTVQAGDAWILIANRAGITTKSLLAVNGATTKTALYPGREICLPAGASTPTAPPTTAAPVAKPVATTKPVTTTKPTTTTAKPVPPAKTYTKAEVAQIIRDVWPDDLEDEAIRIATRESNLVPTVKNFCCYGLFQIYYNVHKGWLATMGITSASQLWDPRVNAYAALALYYRSNSWAPWKL